jgi:hypothetical protein
MLDACADPLLLSTTIPVVPKPSLAFEGKLTGNVVVVIVASRKFGLSGLFTEPTKSESMPAFKNSVVGDSSTAEPMAV